MNADKVNRWLTLGANIGVLLGIILLVAELNQNSAMVRAQTRNEMSKTLVELLSLTAGNGELARILRRANAGEELTPDERLQFQERQLAMFRYWENVHYQFREGLYDETEFSKQRDAWRAYVNQSQAIADAWCGVRNFVANEFAVEVDKLLAISDC